MLRFCYPTLCLIKSELITSQSLQTGDYISAAYNSGIRLLSATDKNKQLKKSHIFLTSRRVASVKPVTNRLPQHYVAVNHNLSIHTGVCFQITVYEGERHAT